METFRAIRWQFFLNLPCATSHSNASKLDTVFVVQCFIQCLLVRREEKRKGREEKRREENGERRREGEEREAPPCSCPARLRV